MVTKKQLVERLRIELGKKELPSSFKLNNYETVINPTLFFESHLCVIENNNNAENHSKRLKKALEIVGIDIINITKSIKKSNVKNT